MSQDVEVADFGLGPVFRVGDRVGPKHPIYGQVYDFTGEIIYIRELETCLDLHIKRDDGKSGIGIAYTAEDGRLTHAWIVNPSLCRLLQPAWAFPKGEPAKHVAGLDPETIDTDAYRDFMRNL